jgi:hypothetical protein
MLSELSPQQFNELRAQIEVLGIDDLWQPAATVAAVLNNKLEQIAAGLAGKSEVPKSQLRKAEDYMPLLRTKKEARKVGGMMTPDELLVSVSALMKR